MLKQRTLQKGTKTTGVGLHTGVRVEMMLRPAPPDTGIVFHRTDLAHSPAIPALAANVGDTRLSSTLQSTGRSDFDGGASDVGACRVGHRQSARRHCRSRDPDHGWERRAVRVSAAVGRHRRAVRTQTLFARHVDHRSQRRRQVGALRALRRLQARLHHRFPASGLRLREPERRRRLRAELVREGSCPGAHLRLHAGRRGDARGGPGAGRQPAERHRAR